MIDLLEKLESVKRRFEEVSVLIGNPNVVSDMKRYISLNKEYKELQPIIEKHRHYKNVIDGIAFSKEILNTEKDEEMREMAKTELNGLEEQRKLMEEEIKFMLVPKDPEDTKNAVMEIRAGTGGDEASIFAGDLFRMYCRYCENKGFKIELVDSSQGTVGGFKEVIFNVVGQNAYGTLKFESGVHRVQRVPQTETMGRVHTSAATVIVLPEADEFDVVVKESDIRKDIFCSSGPGGQSVNTTKSAIRLTHIPTGIIVQCQDEKSQLKNYSKALSVLRSRIYEIELQRRMDEDSKKRKTMVASGDRSAKIRTYNYPQSRVTDHRIGFSTHNLPVFMSGEIQQMIDSLQVAENTERLKEGAGV